ncbi:hypothetical protein ABVV53_11745 [Novosphingobium sp. RD2P27]|uniref:HTH tetR-type domain-containing protein n=1 Tax=Novosphingobium kalidii TaxID=3230299 RepID=A0ABV2D2L9_9SPHN
MLRSATLARLSSRIAPGDTAFATGFEGFLPSIDRPPEDASASARRAREIGAAVAALIRREGVASISHRSVAASACIPKSSIAHHFRTREGLLKAGLVQIHVQLIAADDLFNVGGDVMPDMTLSIASHSIAIEATRDPALIPSALNLRKMRAQFIVQELSTRLREGRADLAALNAAGMILIGAGLGIHLAGGEMFKPLTHVELLLRR